MIIVLFAVIGGVVIGLIAILLSMVSRWKKKNEEEGKYVPTTQDQLPVENIRGRILKLKTGGYRAVLNVFPINISLMEIEERENVLQQYASLLTALDFDVQYLVQSREVDISPYLKTIDEKIKNESNPLIAGHLQKHKQFLIGLTRERSILTKKFYFVIPYDDEIERPKPRKKANKKKQKEKIKQNLPKENEISIEEERFERAAKVLYSRVDTIDHALRRAGIGSEMLEDSELLEVLYTAYNKERSAYQPLKDVDPQDYMTIRVERGDKKYGV